MLRQGQADMDQLDSMKELRSMDDTLNGRRQSDQRMTARFKKRQTKSGNGIHWLPVKALQFKALDQLRFRQS